jgi:ATP-dependent DNA helicase RecQ
MDYSEALEKNFGHSTFRDGQKEVIDSILADRSALAIFPTGGGKSLCYQLPALLLDGLTLVVSPLIALMKDQVDTLVAKGISAARLDSTLSADEAISLYQRLENGDFKLLYVAPERLANEKFRARLANSPSSLSTKPIASRNGATIFGPTTSNSPALPTSSKSLVSSASPPPPPPR